MVRIKVNSAIKLMKNGMVMLVRPMDRIIMDVYTMMMLKVVM